MDARSALDDKLAAIPENFSQTEPFRTTELHLEGWLDADKLPPGTLAEAKSLVWRRGSGLFFSGYNLIADRITSPALQLALLRQLTRKLSVILTLQIPGSDRIGEVISYHSVHGRHARLLPRHRTHPPRLLPPERRVGGSRDVAWASCP